jgi:metal-responsive CopG/Arc/MetJ family transcriptional regulator
MAMQKIQFNVDEKLHSQLQEIIKNGNFNTRTDGYVQLMRLGVECFQEHKHTEQEQEQQLSFYP